MAREKKRQNGGQVEDVERKMDQEAVDDLGAAQQHAGLQSMRLSQKPKIVAFNR